MPLNEVPLNFTNLAHLDEGRMDRLLRHHIQRTAADMMARPGDKTARKVCMEFTLKPVAGPEGELDEVTVEIEVKSKTPVHRSKPYIMRPVNGGLVFNADFPDSRDQVGLPFGEQSSDEEDDE